MEKAWPNVHLQKYEDFVEPSTKRRPGLLRKRAIIGSEHVLKRWGRYIGYHYWRITMDKVQPTNKLESNIDKDLEMIEQKTNENWEKARKAGHEKRASAVRRGETTEKEDSTGVERDLRSKNTG